MGLAAPGCDNNVLGVGINHGAPAASASSVGSDDGGSPSPRKNVRASTKKNMNGLTAADRQALLDILHVLDPDMKSISATKAAKIAAFLVRESIAETADRREKRLFEQHYGEGSSAPDVVVDEIVIEDEGDEEDEEEEEESEDDLADFIVGDVDEYEQDIESGSEFIPDDEEEDDEDEDYVSAESESDEPPSPVRKRKRLRRHGETSRRDFSERQRKKDKKKRKKDKKKMRKKDKKKNKKKRKRMISLSEEDSDEEEEEEEVEEKEEKKSKEDEQEEEMPALERDPVITSAQSQVQAAIPEAPVASPPVSTPLPDIVAAISDVGTALENDVTMSSHQQDA